MTDRPETTKYTLPICHRNTGDDLIALPLTDEPTTTKPPKKVLSALEKVFAAEINGRLPFQSKASVYRDLLAAGLVAWMSHSFGSGVTVSGYELTLAGRYLYCANCENGH